MKNKKIFYLLLLILVLPLIGLGQSKTISLVSGWSFCNADSNIYHSASVPGSVVSDLMNATNLANPFIGDNESRSQWIGEKYWIYQKSFSIEKVDFTKFSCAELIFEGIDTYASVYLNDTLIYEADNMFVSHKIDVKKWIKIGQNQLKVVFPPIIPLLKNKAKRLPYTLPENERVFARKAQFHFGWDWAPKVLNPAIYKPVYLNLWNSVKVSQPVVNTSLENTTGKVYVKVPVSVAGKQGMDLLFKVTDEQTNEVRFQKIFKINSDTIIGSDFIVDNAKVWNPSGAGIPNLYHYKITITTPKGEKFEFLKQIGFRNIELIQTPDSIGSSFYFNVNGQPLFAKGANWVPMEYLPHLNTPEKYRKLIGMAKDAGYNMLRVWGGGWYEDDFFYELCDSLGIMVWQDAMFACAMYPSDEAYLNNVSNEIQFQSKRLSSHASIVLWCGNNENYEGWFNWGWQKQLGYSATDSISIWKGNKRLFENVIPQALMETYGTTAFNYHPSSPSNGWGRDTAYKTGDVHYWGVWWGMEPFSIYQKKVGRFVSEYGFQGYPSVETLHYGAGEKIDSLNQKSVASHQKHPRGYQTIDEYMQRDYPKPTTVEDYIYISQLMQADGMGEAIKAHTQRIPYCMGSLFWQFNDCWSSISWSAIDYLMNPKPLYYASKRLFKQVTPLIVLKEDHLQVVVQNLGSVLFKGYVDVFAMDYSGRKIMLATIPISIPANTSTKVYQIPESVFLYKDCFVAELSDKELSPIAQNLYFKDVPKEMKLQKTDIHIEYFSSDDNLIQFTSDVPIKGLWLKCEGFSFSDNGFDVIPGKKYIVKYDSFIVGKKLLLKDIVTISLNDVLNR